MARRRPWGSQIAVKRSKVNDEITCPLNFKNYSYFFHILKDITMPMEQCVPCDDEQTNCSETPQKKQKVQKR